MPKQPNGKSKKTTERRIGDAGVAVAGGTLGAAAAGTAAAGLGATAIPGVTAIASAVGVTALAATPVGWTIAGAALGAVTVFGVTRLVYGGAKTEGRWAQRDEDLRERKLKEEHDKRAASVTESDFAEFRNFVERSRDQNSLIEPRYVDDLLGYVRNGIIEIAEARTYVEILNMEGAELGGAPDSDVNPEQAAMPMTVDPFGVPNIPDGVSCEVCGTKNEDRYCGECGAEFPRTSTAESSFGEGSADRVTRYASSACLVCRAEPASYCVHCGASLARDAGT